MGTNYSGQLVVDHKRGVIYFHSYDEKVIEKIRTVTILRISGLPTPIPINTTNKSEIKKQLTIADKFYKKGISHFNKTLDKDDRIFDKENEKAREELLKAQKIYYTIYQPNSGKDEYEWLYERIDTVGQYLVAIRKQTRIIKVR